MIMRFSTADVAPEHRFEAWHAFNTEAHPGVVLDSPHQDDFVATVDVHIFGTLAVSTMANHPVRAQRSAASVLAHGADELLLTQVRSGDLFVDRAGTEVAVAAGSMVAFDWARPMTVMNQAGFTSSIVTLNLALLGHRRSEIEALMARPMSATGGLGGLLAYLMADLTTHGETYEPALVAHLTSSVVDLLGAAVRAARGGHATSARNGLRRAQIYDYIDQSLAEPDLTPAVIAHAQGISIRQLDRLLREGGDSPASYIRRRRLDRCRDDLVDPAMAEVAVSAIGARWGFLDPAGFGRVFRREFGMSPGEYRRLFGPPARRASA